MRIVDLPVTPREKLGSANARRSRRAGQIPCVLYGGGRENVALATGVDEFAEVRKAHAAIVRLHLGDIDQTALVREVQWDPFGDYIQHIDFVRVGMDEEVELSIPIHVLGTPKGASEGGLTQVGRQDVEVFARVDSIPTSIDVDIEHLDIGDTIYVEDLEFPANVRPASLPDDLVVHVVPPPAAPEEDGEEAEGEAAEGEAPAEGEKPEGEGEGESGDDESSS